jgi:hypothetical protein
MQSPRCLRVGLAQTWFARVLRDGTSLAVAGAFAPFKEVGLFHAQQLLAEENLAQGQDGQEAASNIIAGFNEVVAYPDVGPGFAGLVDAGVKVGLVDLRVFGAYWCWFVRLYPRVRQV